MARKTRIGLREVRELDPGELLWDTSVIGFGARRQRSEAISYVLFYRTHDARQRWHTIGRHGAPWTPEMAREEAKRLLGDVARQLDPAANRRAARNAQTVSELCDLYVADAEAGRVMTRFKRPKKASTLAIDRGRIDRHIKPLLGKLKVASVTTTDVENLLHDVAAGKTAAKVKTKPRGLARVRGGRGTANRVVRLLGGMFTYAIKHRMRPDNPVRGVQQFEDGENSMRLKDAEYLAFGKALREAEATADIWPPAIAAARFLALTGWRPGEVLALRDDEFDLDRRTAWLPDSKTGKSMRPLSRAACDVLRSATCMGRGNLVFPASRGDGDVVMTGFKRMLGKMLKIGKLSPDITPNVIGRHSFSSIGADLQYSDLTIGTIIGHKKKTVTSIYARAADPVLLAAADDIANRVLELMGEARPEATFLEMLPRRRA
jgi:integrase